MAFTPRSVVARAGLELRALRVLREAGMAQPRFGLAIRRAESHWKSVQVASVVAWAQLDGERHAVRDEAGALTYKELDGRSDAVARGLLEEGVARGDVVGVLCRNHRGFLDATLGASKLGCTLLLLNTSFAGPQLADVLTREGASTVLCDPEFGPMVAEHGGGIRTVVVADEVGGPALTTGDLMVGHLHIPPDPPPRGGRIVILTSGTTGTPKGANRPDPKALPSTAAMMFSRIPYRMAERWVIAAPLFHAWGLAQMLLCLSTGGTVVLRRRFRPADALADVEANRAEVLAVVPVMLQRMLDLPPDERGGDYSSLRITAASGSALPGSLALAWMDTFGDNLYNFYGSTEVASATVAGPDDLRAAPGTAGRPPLGTVVRLLDDHGRDVPPGEKGRVFVANSLQFEGYTGGGSKEVVDGLMSTGDVGHLDAEGRLFIDGRDDDMIVSGGENVFPREVEDLLVDHPEVAEAAVVGVPDDEFGQRLAAYVVPARGVELDPEHLRAHVREHLASYKVPRDVHVVDELPRNATGKVLRRRLGEGTG